MHPMERLRYVARAGAAGGADAGIVVAETVDALARLRPNPSELVTVCRQLVHRNPACGPLWWLAARLLTDGFEHLFDIAGELDDDPTVDGLVDGLPDGGTVVTIGFPEVAARAIAQRGDILVLAVDAGAAAPALVRMLDRAAVDVTTIDPAAMRAAVHGADLVIIDVLACSDERVIAPMGAGLLATVAMATATPRWVVTPLGTRLPRPFVDAAAVAVPLPRRLSSSSLSSPTSWESAFEVVDLAPLAPDDRVAGPEGVAPLTLDALRPDCPYVPELLPPT